MHFHWCRYYAFCTSRKFIVWTTTQQQPFYGPLSRITRVSPYQKKHSPTHHPDHHPIFISFFHLPQSIASSLFKLRAWQSFCTTCVHVLFGLPLGLKPFTSYSIISVCCSINIIISSIPSLSLNSLLGTLSFTFTVWTWQNIYYDMPFVCHLKNLLWTVLLYVSCPASFGQFFGKLLSNCYLLCWVSVCPHWNNCTSGMLPDCTNQLNKQSFVVGNVFEFDFLWPHF